MRYQVSHRTTYHYADAVALSHNLAHLSPRDSDRQQVQGFELRITPKPGMSERLRDAFGNRTDVFTIQDPHTELVVIAESTIETSPAVVPDAVNSPTWEDLAALLANAKEPAVQAASEFCVESPHIPIHADVAAYAKPSLTPGRTLVAAAIDLTTRIYTDCTYDGDATGIDSTVLELLETRRGVCQDFAHLMIACLRSHGLAARYVSGYLETQPPPGQVKLVGADASHAWVQVWCGHDIGWLDLDPTNDCIPGEHHITVAIGRDFSDVTPLKGIILGGGNGRVDVGVDVSRV